MWSNEGGWSNARSAGSYTTADSCATTKPDRQLSQHDHHRMIDNLAKRLIAETTPTGDTAKATITHKLRESYVF
jgi:hypothetical protein